MKIFEKNIIIISLTFLMTASSFSQIVVPNKLESPKEEFISKIDRSKIWITGQWIEQNNKYIWQNGYWESKRPGFIFLPGHWKKLSSGWTWISGFWKEINIETWNKLYS